MGIMSVHNRRLLNASIIAALAVAAILLVPLATAHIIQVFGSTVKANPQTPYILFSAGPEANMVNLLVYNVSGQPGSLGAFFSMTVPLINASYIYIYEPLEMTVESSINSNVNVYISNVYTNASHISYMFIIISNSAGSKVANLTVIKGGSPITTPTSAVNLAPGTYYVSIEIVPSLPITSGASETVTVYVAAEVPTSSTVTPPVLS